MSILYFLESMNTYDLKRYFLNSLFSWFLLCVKAVISVSLQLESLYCLVLAVGLSDRIITEGCPWRSLLQTHHELARLGWGRIIWLVTSLWFVFVYDSCCCAARKASRDVRELLSKVLWRHSGRRELIFLVLLACGEISQSHVPRIRAGKIVLSSMYGVEIYWPS